MSEPPPNPGRVGESGYRARPPGFIATNTRREHRCPLPAQYGMGALWRCQEGHLWVIDEACECRGRFERHGGRGIHTVGLAYWPASWWQRRRYGPGMKRARLWMANENRVEGAPRGTSPSTALGPTDFDG